MGDLNVWGDSEYGIPDPEYGVFGDIGTRWWTERDLKTEEEARRRRKKRDAEAEVSRNFNSYMIELFNAAQKRC